MFNRLKLFFKTSKYYRKVIIEQNKLLDNKLSELVTKIESLDQDKVYFVVVDDYDDVRVFKDLLSLVSKRMRWSPPLIIIINKRLISVKVK